MRKQAPQSKKKRTAKTSADVATAKRSVGRPRKELDEEKIKALAAIQCTMTEIAAVMGCHIDTLRDNYSNVIKEGQENGRMSLRRSMFKSAQGGNVTAQIWLSKQHLGMKDKIEIDDEDMKTYRIAFVQS